MKILHFSIHYKISSGVVNQIGYEQAAAKSIGEKDWDNLVFTNYGMDASYVVKSNFPGGKLLNYLLGRFSAFWWLAKHAKHYDIVLLRHNLGDPFEFMMTLVLKRYITVHHTMELDEAKNLGGMTGAIQRHIEKTLGRVIIRRAVAVIGVTNEIVLHEKDRIRAEIASHVYPNGIDVNSFPEIEDTREGVPKFLFIAANFSPWHGLDYIFDTFAKDDSQCEIHIVGKCNDEQQARMKSDRRFIFHGELPFKSILNISKTIDVGISSLALERAGLKEACTLKVREYLASGIPVYSGHMDTALPLDFPYYRMGSAKLSDMVQFANEMRHTPRNVVSDASRPYINKMELVLSLANWLRALP